MAGLTDGADLFVRRVSKHPEGQSANNSECFSIFHFGDGQLQSVDSVNCPRDHMLARKLLAGRINPAPEQVADPEFDLKSLI